MARTPPYRRSSGQPAARALTLRRPILPALLLVAIIVAGFAIAGNAFALVLETLLQFAFVLPILLAAAMLGLACTAPLARRQVFATCGWPDGFRLILSIALGLGALSLTTLALGSTHLLHDGIPLLPLLLAAMAGAFPTWQFLREFNRPLWREPLQAPDFLLLLAAIPLAVLAIAVTLHPGMLWASEGRGYDVLEYHLQTPREYFEANSTAPLHHNVYSFLPANIEMLYLLLMSLISTLTRSAPGWPTTINTVYPAQMLHATLTLLAAAAVALAPLKLSRLGRICAFLLILTVPWTLIIGSLAYNDAGVLLYGALAIALTLAPQGKWVIITLGVLLGLAVGTKMTAGVMIAVPVAAALLLQRRWLALPVIAAIVLLCYSPWALRSMIDTHRGGAGRGANPVFPIAAETLGLGHWTPAQAQQWSRGHSPQGDLASPVGRLQALADQSLLDPQWSPGGAVLTGEPASWPLRLGILWLLGPVLIILALTRGIAAWHLLAVGGVQILCWLLFTHLQARFLLPAVIPLALLGALAMQSFRAVRIAAFCTLTLQAAYTALVLISDLNAARLDFSLCGLITRYPDAVRYPDRRIAVPENATELPRLRDDVSTLLIGDAAPLFYHGHVSYNTVWDDNPLADHLAAQAPNDVIQWLFEQNYGYMLVNWSEVHRLHSTYGYPDIISEQTFSTLERTGLRRAPFAVATDRTDPRTGQTLTPIVIYAIHEQAPIPHSQTLPAK